MHMMESLMECETCLQQFDYDQRRPRLLICGHTVCTLCIKVTLAVNSRIINCPYCRMPLDQDKKKPEEFPTNYKVLKMMDLQKQQIQNKHPGKSKEQNDLKLMKKDVIEKTATEILSCRTHLVQLQERFKQIRFERCIFKEKRNDLLDELHKSEVSNLKVHHRINDMSDSIIEGAHMLHRLEEARHCMKNAGTMPDLTSANQEAEHCYEALQNWNTTRHRTYCKTRPRPPQTQHQCQPMDNVSETHEFKWHAMINGGPDRAWYSPATYVNDKIYCFGIANPRNEDDITTSMDVHIFNCSTYSWSVSGHQKNANIGNFPQWGYSADNLGEKIYIWGGCSKNSSCNTLYIYSTENNTWSKPDVSGNPPQAGWQHSACIINHHLFTFGGNGVTDVHSLNLQSLTWRKLQTAGQPPTPRAYHTAVSINHIIYVWGGCKPFSPVSEELTPHIYALDTKSNIWSTFNCTENAPIGRRGHSAFEYKNEMYIYGGWSHVRNTDLKDIHAYDPSTNKWREIKPSFNGPKPLEGHVSLVVGTKLFVVGGADRNVGTRGSIWILNMI